MRVIVHQIDGAATMRAMPLAAGVLVATARSDPFLGALAELEIVVAREAPDVTVARYVDPDVLAFSCYVWNTRHSLAVARRARERHPRALIVLGGPSAPRRRDAADTFLREHAYVDVLVFGEGELAFRELLVARAVGQEPRHVAGLAWRDASGSVVHTAPRERISDLAETSSPYLDGTFDALADRLPQLDAAVIETNRGCPFACTFCDWGQATASRVVELPRRRVEGEFAWAAGRRLPYVYVVDANFGIRPRDVEIAEYVGELRRRTGFPAHVSFHLTKNATDRNLEIFDVLARAGVGCQMGLSMQSFDGDVLAAVKRSNIRVERSLDLRRRCHERGVSTFNELILGLPRQTYVSLRDGVIQAITPHAGDRFFVYACCVLPNTELASPEQRATHGLVTSRCDLGDFNRPVRSQAIEERGEVVIATNTLPPDDWRRAYRFAQIASAFHNLRLLHVVIQFVWRTLDEDLGAWIEAVDTAISTAPAVSPLGALHAVLERHVTAIRSGGRLVTEDPALPGHLWTAPESVALVFLREGDAVYDALRDVTESWLAERAVDADLRDVVAELFAYQSLLVPCARGAAAPPDVRFMHDWPAYHESLRGHPPRLVRRPTVVARRVAPECPMTTTYLVEYVREAYSVLRPNVTTRSSGSAAP